MAAILIILGIVLSLLGGCNLLQAIGDPNQNRAVGGVMIGLVFLIPGILAFVYGVKRAGKPSTSLGEEQQTREDLKKCPFCAELIKRDAVVCRYCGRDLGGSTQVGLHPPSHQVRSLSILAIMGLSLAGLAGVGIVTSVVLQAVPGRPPEPKIPVCRTVDGVTTCGEYSGASMDVRQSLIVCPRAAMDETNDLNRKYSSIGGKGRIHAAMCSADGQVALLKIVSIDDPDRVMEWRRGDSQESLTRMMLSGR